MSKHTLGINTIRKVKITKEQSDFISLEDLYLQLFFNPEITGHELLEELERDNLFNKFGVNPDTSKVY